MRKPVTVTLEEGLVEKLDLYLAEHKAGTSRSSWIERVLREALLDPGASAVKAGKKAAAKIASDKRMDQLLDDQLVEAMRANPELMSDMDPKDLARLVAARTPRLRNQDEELQQSYLSLTKALEQLPDTKDITAECARLRGLVIKAEAERDFCAATLTVLRRKLKIQPGNAWGELRRAILEAAVRIREYAVDCQAKGIEVDDLRLLVEDV